jgi:orotidine-5'-phosphate decarboxylase
MSGAHGLVGILKPQVGYFERFGAAGYEVLETVISEARGAGFAVIADAKRGDIGSTMEGYASAWLGDGPLACDAMTVSPYQGFDALEPAFRAAGDSGAVVFVLAATSNPDAGDVQRAVVKDVTLSATIARRARERSSGDRTVGVVVGSTRDLESSGLSSADLEGILVLAPGFGAQGARLSDLHAIFGRATPTVIPSVSRSVLGHGLDGINRAIGEHLRELGL